MSAVVLYSEMGWLTSSRRRQRGLIRYYCRLNGMDSDRVPKQLFEYTRNNALCWAPELQKILEELGLMDYGISSQEFLWNLLTSNCVKNARKNCELTWTKT